ncbi:hypothetical protein EYF80_035805 [Liparis tanakae]|uniref:Uncharacterized protein n=1 Tax=Liparis tanakae TaxID=230148 RepID=A0A4Z2GL91_9TELE|nr:hypothetical protein EYF80_035805 [Liparis tanakae]
MAERTSTGLLTMMLEPTPAVAMTLPAEVREKLAELELELSEAGTDAGRAADRTSCMTHFKDTLQNSLCATSGGPARLLFCLHQLCDVNSWLSVLPPCREDGPSAGLCSVVLKALTSDPLLLTLHRDERCVPCRSQKTNEGRTPSFSRAGINLHFLPRAKGTGRRLETMCYLRH